MQTLSQLCRIAPATSTSFFAVNRNDPNDEWQPLAETAAAARRVNSALSGRKTDDALLAHSTTVLNELADELEKGDLRVKLDDFLTRPHLAEIYAGQFRPIPVENGEEIEFDPFSIGGGYLHPSSVGITFVRESDDSVSATCNIDPMFAGPPERAHGGLLALVIDEAMGALNRMRGRQAFTANLSIDYRAGTALNEPLQFRAWVHNVDGRKITLRASGHHGDMLCVEAEGLFIERKDQPPGTAATP